MEGAGSGRKGKRYAFFQNTECEFFPCHKLHGEADPARFNCLFCYCPLYALGRKCGGSYRYTERGIKDCTGCVFPHVPENYGRIMEAFSQIMEVVRREDGTAQRKTGEPGAEHE